MHPRSYISLIGGAMAANRRASLHDRTQ